MASGTGKLYASAFLSLLNKEIDLDSDTIKAMLVTNAYAPSPSHCYKSDVTNEVTGTGYTAGGATLTGVTVAYTAANSWSQVAAVSTAYAVGDIRRPSTGNGFLYRAAVAGTSGGSAPTWPTTVGATVVDGGVTWENIGAGAVVFDAADVSWASSTITARTVVIYDSTPATDATRPLIGYITLDADLSSSGGPWSVTWDAGGIFVFTAS